jgi:iron complex outermembrane receptor protein
MFYCFNELNMMLKMKILALPIYVFAVLLIPQILLANHVDNPNPSVLTGKLVDATTHKPLVGATVTIHDLKLGVITNDNGDYDIKGLPIGDFLVEVKFVGYATVTKNVALKGSETVNFSLNESAAEIGEVVVTGTSKATQIKRSPVPVVTVNHSYLLSNTATNAIDAIAKIPGVQTVTTGPNVSKPIIRGLGYNRILILYDVVRLKGQ